jgi:hypothetical protein
MSDLGVEFRYGIPPFRFVLPPGWVRRMPTSAGQQEDVRKASAIFMRAGRPDLDAEYRTMMAQAGQGMRRTKVFAIYRQENVPLEELLPLSITASALDAPDGGNLDSWVSEAFRTRGASFLDENLRHIVRWASEPQRPEGAAAINGVSGRTLTYAIPVPGTNRRKALVFTSTIVIPDGNVISEDVLGGIELLSDSMVSTFAWEQLAEEPAVPAAVDDAQATPEPCALVMRAWGVVPIDSDVARSVV